MAKPQSKLPELLGGQFDDGPLIGLGYRPDSQQGVTDEQGRFFYQNGEQDGQPSAFRPESMATQRNLQNGVFIDDTVRDVVGGHADGISFTSVIDTFEQAPAVRAVFSELGRRFRGVEEEA
ncbi:hypothetical protein TrVFT333_001774 [Trichoderma virens FT-333]|nr:hypothetical protein TrVFT333_001774 [Trichoderma virens FT-333]